jgi:hypothetical protein
MRVDMRSTAILAVLVATMLVVWGAGSAMAVPEPTATGVQAQSGDDVPVLMQTDGGNVTENETDDGNETVGNATFGQQLNQFKHQLRNQSNLSFVENLSFAGMDVENASFGMIVAEWVVRNNPGNAPPWAGPGNKTMKENRTGPPSWAGNDSDSSNETGPPDWAGNDSDSGNETGPGNGHGNGNGGGPPGQLDRAFRVPLKSNTLG